jgi:ribonuclease HI
VTIADDSAEWQSVLAALRSLSVEEREKLGDNGVIAYTDGACIKNPGGPAGWAAIVLSAADVTGNVARDGAPRIECYGHIPKAPTTTNNRAEITALLAALSIAPVSAALTIYSDSNYAIKVAQGVFKMKANEDLWSLYRVLLAHRRIPPTFIWVQGHAGHNLNERADELAGLGAFSGDKEAYRSWQESSVAEAHNRLAPDQFSALHWQAQKLKALDERTQCATSVERQFITDMANRLQKNNFRPTEKQINWLKGLATKYRV